MCSATPPQPNLTSYSIIMLRMSHPPCLRSTFPSSWNFFNETLAGADTRCFDIRRSNMQILIHARNNSLQAPFSYYMNHILNHNVVDCTGIISILSTLHLSCSCQLMKLIDIWVDGSLRFNHYRLASFLTGAPLIRFWVLLLIRIKISQVSPLIDAVCQYKWCWHPIWWGAFRGCHWL